MQDTVEKQRRAALFLTARQSFEAIDATLSSIELAIAEMYKVELLGPEEWESIRTTLIAANFELSKAAATCRQKEQDHH